MKKNILYLEGMRGIAALIVVVSHFFQLFLPATLVSGQNLEHTKYEAMIRSNPLNFFYNGNFSVCLFFILSGYVLSARFFQTKDETSFYQTALKRYPRLAIPAFISVFIGFLISASHLSFFETIQPITSTLMQNPFEQHHSLIDTFYHGFILNFFHYESTYNPVLWTMTYELFGSFLIFSFLWLVGKHTIRYAVYIVLIVCFIQSYYLAFILGLILSDFTHSSLFQQMQTKKNLIFLTIMTIIGIYFSTYPYVNVQDTIYEPLRLFGDTFPYLGFYHILGAFGLFVVVLLSNTCQTFFSHPICTYIGKLSFSLYLIHFSILFTFSSYVFSFFISYFSYGLSFLCTVLVSIPLLWIVSHVFYQFVDAKLTSFLSSIFSFRKKYSFNPSKKDT